MGARLASFHAQLFRPNQLARSSLLFAACLLAACSAGPLGTATSAAQDADQLAQPCGRLGRKLEATAPPPDPPYAPNNLPLNKIKLPPGFTISLYANASFPARFFAVGNRGRAVPGVTFASTVSGRVYAMVDPGRGQPVVVCTLLRGLDNPNGIAYDTATGVLYVSEVRRIVAYSGADAAALAGCDARKITQRLVVGPDVLPEQAGHPSRGLGLGPDGKLYVTIAAPFNVNKCLGKYCSIWRVNTNGSSPEPFAKGIRNAASFTWHPKTRALVFSGMERDLMGNDLPDDLMGIIPASKAGLDLGWPYCHWSARGSPLQRLPGPGALLPDPDMTPPGFPVRPNNTAYTAWCQRKAWAPLQALGPHIAPLGILYWPPLGLPSVQQRWPAAYGNGFFSAQHGSWNRDVPIGYRLMHVRLSADSNRAAGYSTFATGWLQPDGTAWGRPTGLARLPDGSMLVGDDRANVVYRISYTPPPLAAGVYTLRLLGRNACPIRGYAMAGNCSSTQALGLTASPVIGAHMKWRLFPAASGLKLFEGAPITIRSVLRSTCPRPFPPSFASSGACSATGVALGSLGGPVAAKWKLWSGPGGYFIQSVACPTRYLGLTNACGPSSLGQYLPAANVALLWELTKVA